MKFSDTGMLEGKTGGIFSILLRTTQQQPLYEHLSFRCGNAIYFVFVDTEKYSYSGMSEGFRQTFLDVSIAAKAIPCYISMRAVAGGEFVPALAGWGLRHFVTQEEIDPAASFSEELVELSEWELQDIAVRYLIQYIENGGWKISTWQSYVDVDPSIWIDLGEELAWVVVRAGRGTSDFKKMPENIKEIDEGIRSGNFRISGAHFATLNVFDPNNKENPELVYRGRPLSVVFRTDSENRQIIFEPIPNSGQMP